VCVTRKELRVQGSGTDGVLRGEHAEREFFIDNLLVRIHLIIVMIRWTGLAPWEFKFPFPGEHALSRSARPRVLLPQRRGNTSEACKNVCLEANASILPWLSYLCHIFSRAAQKIRRSEMS